MSANSILIFNSYCCFCNNNINNGAETIFHVVVTSAENRAKFFRQYRTCENCLKIANSRKSYFNFPPIAAPNDDVMKFLKEMHFFVPKIDQCLLPRFAKMLVGLEEYSFARLSKETLRLFTPRKLIVVKDMTLNGEKRFIPYFENFNILVTQKFEARDISLDSDVTKYVYQKLFNFISSKQVDIKAKVVALRDMQIKADMLYLLLSCQLVELQCFNVTFTTPLNPVVFIEKLPYIEKFIFCDIDDTYFDELETLSISCQVLKKFCLSFKCLGLTRDSFNDIIKKWSKNQRIIFVYLHAPDDGFLIDFCLDNYIEASYDSLMETNKCETQRYH